VGWGGRERGTWFEGFFGKFDGGGGRASMQNIVSSLDLKSVARILRKHGSRRGGAQDTLPSKS
jgi:hypothetical protein